MKKGNVFKLSSAQSLHCLGSDKRYFGGRKVGFTTLIKKTTKNTEIRGRNIQTGNHC